MTMPRAYCKRGHPLEGAPVRNGIRICQECARIRRSEWKARAAAERVTVPCPTCGKNRVTSKANAWRLRGQRCPSCAQKQRYDERERAGLPRSSLKGTGGKRCAHCGGPMRKNARVKHCSMACRKASGQYDHHARALAASRRGDGNPNFRHGERRNARDWSLKAKGERQCRNCPAEAVHLHHIVPRSRWPGTERDDLRNGMPLCARCHSRWHRKSPGAPDHTCITDEEREYINTTAPVDSAWIARSYPTR